MQVIWSSDARELCPESNPDINGETSCLATLTPSDTQLKLQVTDPEGEECLTSITIDVQETEAPTITLIFPTAAGFYYSDQPIHFSAIINDTEYLTYTWESNQEGEIGLSSSPYSDGSISGYTTLTEGQHAITLMVEDTSGKYLPKMWRLRSVVPTMSRFVHAVVDHSDWSLSCQTTTPKPEQSAHRRFLC